MDVINYLNHEDLYVLYEVNKDEVEEYIKKFELKGYTFIKKSCAIRQINIILCKSYIVYNLFFIKEKI